jgi:Peptidase family M1 domain
MGLLRSCLVLGLVAFAATGAVSHQAQPASQVLELYRQLGSAELDPARVYQIREASLDRGALHLTFNDGTVAFTRAVDGHVTGAFFEGDGDLLVMPSTLPERASLAEFTKATTLEESFSSAYLRFDDDTFHQLEPDLRPPGNAEEFLARWNTAVQELAYQDALRLLMRFTRQPQPGVETGAGMDRYMHVRVSGVKLGTFDVFYDSRSSEQISIGQIAHVEQGTFFNVWTSFSGNRVRAQQQAEPNAEGEQANRMIRISRYRISTRVNPPHEIVGESEATLEAVQGGWRVGVFELSRYLKLSAVTMEQPWPGCDCGQQVPLAFIQNEALQGGLLARRGNDIVAIVFPKPVPVGAHMRVKFAYSGDVLSEAGGGLMYVGARGIWYPNVGMEMADFDMTFRYPADWTLVATGRRTALRNVGGEQEAHWASDHPLPVAGFNLGRYTEATAQAANIAVATYAAHDVETNFPTSPPQVIATVPARRSSRPVVMENARPQPSSHASDVAQQSARYIDWLTARIGPFPYELLSLTQMPGSSSQGWPGLIYLSSFVYVANDEPVQAHWSEWERALYGRLMLAHEIGHQWWGDAVGWRSYHDQWISEALANYCALMYIEATKPADFRVIMDHLRSELLAKNKSGEQLTDAGPVTFGIRLSSSHFPDGYQGVTYGRGTWLIHMLRHMWRDAAIAEGAKGDPDAAFLRVLRDVAEQYRYKKLSTAELQKAFERALPPPARYDGKTSLDWFFERWVNGTDIPHLELDDVHFSERAGKLQATGKILQKGGERDLITSVPIYAAAPQGGRAVLLGRVFADGPESTFHLTAPAGTRKLLLDPNETVLRQ